MANPTTAWKVTHQQPDTGQDQTGRYVRGQRVFIETGMGHQGSVFVPDSQYSEERVRPMLAALAVRLDSVGKLSS